MVVMPCKKDSADRDAVWDVDSGGQKEHFIRWESRSPYGKEQFENNSQLAYTENESSALETGHHRRANITELASLPLGISQSVHGWRMDVCACCTIQ